MVRATLTVKVRSGVKSLSGTSAKGKAYSMNVVEVLDTDDNKAEIVLPRENAPALTVGTVYEAVCDVDVYGGRLSINAVKLTPVADSNGETVKPLRSAAAG